MKPSNYKNHLYALILAGGGGTRLWPRSRNKTPKQFLPLFNKKTLMQITSERFNKMLPWERIFCVTVSEEYKKEIIREVPDFLPKNIIVEPARRETGPAHGIGAAFISKKDPEAIIITEAADRLVDPIHLYLKTLQKAAKLAFEKDVLITVGVKPRYPNTGYGYIKRGKKVQEVGKTDFYMVDSFKEKPDLATAKRYLAKKTYFWNAGQFVWKAQSLLNAIEKFEPQIKKQLDIISENISSKSVIESSYKKMPKIAIDYAVAERADNLLMVEADFNWTDIGDWKEVWENLKKDESGNVIIDGPEEGGSVINIDTSDAIIHKNGRLIAVIDVDNIVVVDTKDALLIASKSRAQNVKQIVNNLKEKKLEEYL